MSIEGVVDAVPAFLAELKTQFGTALADRVARRRLLHRRAAIFLCQVFGDVRAARCQGGIELERLKVEFSAYLALQPLQRLLERRQAYRAPWARNVGHEVDLEGCRHTSLRMNSTTRLANSAGRSTALKWAVGNVANSAPEMVLRIARAIAGG